MPQVTVHTDFCVKTQEEVDAILENIKQIYLENCVYNQSAEGEWKSEGGKD